MALPNDKITTTLVANTLGSDSRDVGTLCTHTAINKWSKWKPVRHTTVSGVTEAQLEAINYGINLPSVSNNILDAINKTYTYNTPRGGVLNEFYRLGDFRNYNHQAGAPAKGIGDILIYTASTTSYRISLPFNVSGSDTLIGIEELGTIKDCYLGMAITEFGAIKYWRTSTEKIKDNGGIVTWYPNEEPFSGGTVQSGEDYYFFASTEKYAYGDSQPISYFYPLPFLTLEESTGKIIIKSGVGQVRWIATQLSNYSTSGYVEVDPYQYILGGDNQYFSIQPGSGTGAFYIEFMVTNGGTNSVQYVVSNFRSSITPTFADTSDLNSTGFDVMNIYQRNGSTITQITSSFTIPAGGSANIIVGSPNWLGRLNGVNYIVIPNLFKQIVGQLNYNNERIAMTPIINVRS